MSTVFNRSTVFSRKHEIDLQKNDVDLASLALILQQPTELTASCDESACYAGVSVHARIFPFRVLLDEIAVIAYLCGNEVKQPLGVLETLA